MNSTNSTLSGLPALSIKQPWAELVLSGQKTIEIRKWSTEYRGPVWLHTGRDPDEAAMTRFGLTSLFTGGFIGLVTISDIVPFDSWRWVEWRPRHLDQGHGGVGFLAWLLSDVRRLTPPLEGRGGLKLFHVMPSVEQTLVARLLSSEAISK